MGGGLAGGGGCVVLIWLLHLRVESWVDVGALG